MSRSALFLTIAALYVVTLGVSQAKGAVIIYQASMEFSHGTPPAGPAPWLTVTYDDGGASGSVTMTFTATNLVGSEFISGLYLNVVPTVDPNALTFGSPVKTGSFTSPAIQRGTDAFKADGDGYFDILLSFATSGGAGGRFTAGDAVSYTITGPASLTAASFAATSASSRMGYHIAAHVQGIGPDGDDSGWVAEPEPASLSLLALGCLRAIRRRPR